MKKTITLALCLLLLAALLTGCLVKKTPETTAPPAGQTTATAAPAELPSVDEVIGQAAEKMEAVRSLRMKMTLTLNMSLGAEGFTAMEMDMKGDFDCEITKEPEASHMKGSVSSFGQNQAVEHYAFRENGQTVLYNWDATKDTFVRSVQKDGSAAGGFGSFEAFREGNWTLEQTEDAYVLRGELQMSDVNGAIPMDGNMLGSLAGDRKDPEAGIPAVLVIDRQTMCFRSLALDMGAVTGGILGMLDGFGGETTMTLEAAFTDFNSVGPITAPAEYENDPDSSENPAQHEYEEPTARGYSDLSAEVLEKVHPMLFKVTGSGGESMYLFGTIHVGDGRNRYALDLLSSYLDECDALAVEFDTKAFEKDLEAILDMSLKFMYTDGTSAKDHMPADLYDRACAVLAEAGLMPMALNAYNLSMWYQSLEQAAVMTRSDLSADDAMDGALIQYCYNNGIEVRDVESAELQYNLLLSFPDELNLLLIEATLDGMDTAGEELNKLYETWLGGNYEEIAAVLSEEDGDEGDYTAEELALLELYNNEMLVKRNLGMKDRAVEWLNAGDKVFFAVGAAHLVGETGLVTLLREAGYTVEQVDYINP